MKVPLSWLREHVDITVPLADLADRLTMAGLEVAAIERIGEMWDRDSIFVGQVLAVRPHPNADRLVLVTVEYGKDEPLEVVTGAPNLHVGDAGQKVVFATVGARLIDPYADTLKYQTLKRSKIRGVNSEGMVCSEKELGISDEHTGIIILPDDAPVGTPFVEYWGDSVLDIDLTPNLARGLCITGVAREVHALTAGALKIADPTVQASGESIEGKIEISIEDPDLCPRYSAALITGVTIKPSPPWMQRRLSMAGMRPINNIVDITNYVMLEWGQPLHAFDYRLLRPRHPGGVPTIIVRRARQGEKMVTLDGVGRDLSKDMLLITDGGGPVAVAGIMGGQESEVTEATVDVLLESANFNNISIRHTYTELHLLSEASYRFGRGVDPEGTIVALRRAAELMRELGGGAVAHGLADAYPVPAEKKTIDLPVSEVKRILGIQLSMQQVTGMLQGLGFGCEPLLSDGKAEEPTALRVTVPSYRLDVSIAADLLEEIARLYGYDRLPVTLMEEEIPALRHDWELELEERARDILVGCGLAEIISYSMVNLENVAKLKPQPEMPLAEAYLRITNPLSREWEYLRQTLMHTTLAAVADNLRFVDRVAIFEIAHVYLPVDGQALPQEPTMLSIALTGPRMSRSWLTGEEGMLDFYDLKGVVETLCDRLGVQDVTFAPMQHPTYYPGRVASIQIAGAEIGVLGEVHPLVRRNFGLPDQTACLLDLNLSLLIQAAHPVQAYRTVYRMPTVKEDLALVVDESVPADKLEAAIWQAGKPLLVDVLLFDVYRGDQVGAGKRSLAYSLTFQSADKTLTSEETAKQREQIVRRLAQEYGAQIRG
jgi:phenylalanyl-tRNA synthetase beta chain